MAGLSRDSMKERDPNPHCYLRSSSPICKARGRDCRQSPENGVEGHLHNGGVSMVVIRWNRVVNLILGVGNYMCTSPSQYLVHLYSIAH